MPTPDLLLGYVTHISTRQSIGMLEPLCRFTPDGRALERVLSVHERAERHPDAAVVQWQQIPQTVAEGTLWYIQAVPAAGSDTPANANPWVRQVNAPPVVAIELLDVRHVGDIEIVRERLTVTGLPLAWMPASHAYLWLPDDTWIGPVRLDLKPGAEDTWMLKATTTGTPLVAYAPLDASAIATVELERQRRRFLAPRARPTQIVRRLDWSSDDALLRSVLQEYQATGEDYTMALACITEAISVSAASVGEDEHELFSYRLQRATRIVSQLDQRITLIRRLVDQIVQVPQVKEEIERRTAEIEEETRALVAKEAEADLAEIQQRIVAAEAKLTDLQNQQRTAEEALQKIEYAVEERRATIERDLKVIESAFDDRILDLMERPATILADVAIVRAFLGAVPHTLARAAEAAPPAPATTIKSVASTTTAPPALVAPWSDHATPRTPLTSVADGRTAIRRCCYAQGLPATAAFAVHAALLAGAVPVGVGEGALDLLESYADAIAGGRMHWVPVTPTMVEPADLLGRSGAPSELATILATAAMSDTVVLVALDGINRAPVEAYLSPILTAYDGAMRTGRERPLTVVADDGVMRRIVWPPNVLLAATLADGSAIVPLPASFWTHAVLVPLDHHRAQLPPEGRTAPHPDPTSLSAAPFTLWQTWSSQARSDAAPYKAVVTDLAGMLGCTEDTLGEHLVHAAATWATTADAALDAAVLGRLVPRAAARGIFAEVRDALVTTQRWNPWLGEATSCCARALGIESA